jgi:hypothetical protein
MREWRPSLPLRQGGRWQAGLHVRYGKEVFDKVEMNEMAAFASAAAGGPSRSLRQGGLRQGQMKTAFSVIRKLFGLLLTLPAASLLKRSGSHPAHATLLERQRKPPCHSKSPHHIFGLPGY